MLEGRYTDDYLKRQGKLPRILRPDQQVDDFARLYANVSDPETVDFLTRIKAAGGPTAP
jgi:hypothetical protein